MAKAKRARRARVTVERKSTTNRLFEDALSLASTLAASRKRAGADKIVEFAEATRHFGESLNEFPQLRAYSDTAADNLDDLADYVARTEITDMLDDLAGFARRQPVATLTLGVAAGLAVTQLMHGWPVPMKEPGQSPAGNRRRRARRKAVH